MFGLLNSWWYSRANPGAERQKCYRSIIPICYTKKIKFKIIIINDGLCQDLRMFVYFMIMIQHIHLSLWSSFWFRRRLPSNHTLQIYPRATFLPPQLLKFLSGRLYKFSLPKSAYHVTLFRNGYRDWNNISQKIKTNILLR